MVDPRTLEQMHLRSQRIQLQEMSNLDSEMESIILRQKIPDTVCRVHLEVVDNPDSTLRSHLPIHHI